MKRIKSLTGVGMAVVAVTVIALSIGGALAESPPELPTPYPGPYPRPDDVHGSALP